MPHLSTEPNRFTLTFEPPETKGFEHLSIPGPEIQAGRDETGPAIRLGPVWFRLNDRECPPELLWAWLAAVEDGMLPVVCRFQPEVCDVLAEVELAALPGEKPGELRLLVRRFWQSAWEMKPEKRDGSWTAVSTLTDAAWFANWRTRLDEAWRVTRQPNLVRPGDWLDWRAGLPPPSHSEHRESLFWWRLATAFAPTRLPRRLLDDAPAHHRLLRRWAWNTLHPALAAWRSQHQAGRFSWGFWDWQCGGEVRHKMLGDRLATYLDDFLGGDRLWGFQMQNLMDRHPALRRSSLDCIETGWRSGRERALTALTRFLEALHSELSTKASRVTWPPPPPLPACPVRERTWVRHPEYGAGYVQQVFRHHEPMLAEIACFFGPWRTVPVSLLEVTEEGEGLWVDADMFGSPLTGLAGPFAVCSRRFRRAPRCHSHRALGSKITLAVQSAPVPVKRLRGLLVELAKAIAIHHQDLGDELFEILPPGTQGSVEIDLAPPLERNQCWRYGTRMYLANLRAWFTRQYGGLQHRALANGRYFPPPISLNVHLSRQGGIQVVAGFTPGYLRHDSLTVEWPRRVKAPEKPEK